MLYRSPHQRIPISGILSCRAHCQAVHLVSIVILPGSVSDISKSIYRKCNTCGCSKTERTSSGNGLSSLQESSKRQTRRTQREGMRLWLCLATGGHSTAAPYRKGRPRRYVTRHGLDGLWCNHLPYAGTALAIQREHLHGTHGAVLPELC